MTSGPEYSEYLERNRAEWTKWADEYAIKGRVNWAGEPSWGIWSIPEADVELLPDVDGLVTLELGCGTGYVSSWLARRGAKPIGLDPTPGQLATAAVLQGEFDVHFPLIMGAAEAIPIADGSIDFIISEYGASIWSDPYKWIPEAARVLKPGGELLFLVNGTILILAVPEHEGEPAANELLRDYFGLHRVEWPDDEAVEFHLGYGDWIRLLRANGFEVNDLHELRPGPDATTTYDFVTVDWARRWPSEEVWKVRKVR